MYFIDFYLQMIFTCRTRNKKTRGFYSSYFLYYGEYSVLYMIATQFSFSILLCKILLENVLTISA